MLSANASKIFLAKLIRFVLPSAYRSPFHDEWIVRSSLKAYQLALVGKPSFLFSTLG